MLDRQRTVRPSCALKNGENRLRWRCAMVSSAHGAPSEQWPVLTVPADSHNRFRVLVRASGSGPMAAARTAFLAAQSRDKRPFGVMRVVSLHLRSCRRCAPADDYTPSLGRARRPASELPPLGRHPFPLVGVLVLRTLLSGSSVTVAIRRSVVISDFEKFVITGLD